MSKQARTVREWAVETSADGQTWVVQGLFRGTEEQARTHTFSTVWREGTLARFRPV